MSLWSFPTSPKHQFTSVITSLALPIRALHSTAISQTLSNTHDYYSVKSPNLHFSILSFYDVLKWNYCSYQSAFWQLEIKFFLWVESQVLLIYGIIVDRINSHTHTHTHTHIYIYIGKEERENLKLCGTKHT